MTYCTPCLGGVKKVPKERGHKSLVWDKKECQRQEISEVVCLHTVWHISATLKNMNGEKVRMRVLKVRVSRNILGPIHEKDYNHNLSEKLFTS